MAEMLFYQKPEILRHPVHAKIHFTPLTEFSFAKTTSSVPLMVYEFPDACRHYPIVFSQDDKDNIQAHCILALKRGENGFLDEQNQWRAPYIPAYIRRYPFALATLPETNDFAVAFDSESGCFNEEQGEPLYDESGKSSPFLEKQMDFLRKLHQEHRRTQQFLKRLKEESLVSAIKVDIVRGADENKSTIRNLLAVDENKLKELEAEKSAEFLKNGLLAVIYSHLISLKNFDALARYAAEAEKQVAVPS